MGKEKGGGSGPKDRMDRLPLRWADMPVGQEVCPDEVALSCVGQGYKSQVTNKGVPGKGRGRCPDTQARTNGVFSGNCSSSV